VPGVTNVGGRGGGKNLRHDTRRETIQKKRALHPTETHTYQVQKGFRRGRKGEDESATRGPHRAANMPLKGGERRENNRKGGGV